MNGLDGTCLHQRSCLHRCRRSHGGRSPPGWISCSVEKLLKTYNAASQSCMYVIDLLNTAESAPNEQTAYHDSRSCILSDMHFSPGSLQIAKEGVYVLLCMWVFVKLWQGVDSHDDRVQDPGHLIILQSGQSRTQISLSADGKRPAPGKVLCKPHFTKDLVGHLSGVWDLKQSG